MRSKSLAAAIFSLALALLASCTSDSKSGRGQSAQGKKSGANNTQPKGNGNLNNPNLGNGQLTPQNMGSVDITFSGENPEFFNSKKAELTWIFSYGNFTSTQPLAALGPNNSAVLDNIPSDGNIGVTIELKKSDQSIYIARYSHVIITPGQVTLLNFDFSRLEDFYKISVIDAAVERAINTWSKRSNEGDARWRFANP